MRTIRLPLGPVLALALAGGCSSQPTVVPVRNLERPADMTFVCLSNVMIGDQSRLTGRPMAECHPPLGPDPDPFATPPRSFGTFSFITNTSRGELSVADMDNNRLVDLDPAIPGYNTVPLGAFPETIASSQDGCRLVTANRASCDLSLIDPQRLLAPAFTTKASTDPGPVAERVSIVTPSGRVLAAAPKEVTFLPLPLPDLGKQLGAEQACVPGNGAYVGGTRVPYRALVTIPTCDLVAMIELPSGRIVSSAYVRATGLQDAGTEPFCPVVECGPAGGTVLDGGAGTPDAGGSDGAPDGAATPGGILRVGALAVLPDSSRVYVGAEGAPFVAALDITPAGLAIPADGGLIPLHDNPIGVTRLRLSYDPYYPAPGQNPPWLGRFIGDRGGFLYAFTRDDSIRLVDVSGRLPQGDGSKERECDTAVDPLFLGTLEKGPIHGCYYVEAPNQPPLPRRALAVGPGLRIPNTANPDQPPPLPRDIAFADTKATLSNNSSADPTFNGAFGYVLSSSNSVYLLNLDPQQSFLSDNQLMNHSWLDYNLTTRGSGSARVNVLPARNFTATSVPLPVQLPVMAQGGPRLESVPDRDLNGNPTGFESWVSFPDPTAPSPQSWTVSWEGQLPGAGGLAGEVVPPGNSPGPAGALQDLGAAFCDGDVQTGDVLLFPGCSQDTDCSTTGTMVCRQAAAGTAGLCFPKNAPRDEQFGMRCRRQLGTRHRYEIVNATQRRLELALKLDEVPRTALNPCTPHATEAEDTDCHIAPAYSTFRCLQVQPEAAPRCVQPCGTLRTDGTYDRDDRRCRVGTVCEDVAGSQVGPLCVEAPPLDLSCWPLQAAYRIQVGRSFLVTGGSAPRPATSRVEAGQCVPDVTRHPFLVNRIPLDAPHCSNVPDDAATSTTPTALNVIPAAQAGTWPNPCLFQSPNGDEPGTTDVHVKALFENQELRFVMTNLEQWVGDAASTRFDVVGGFLPQTADYPEDVIITLGVRILQGPVKTPASPGMTDRPDRTYTSFPYIYVVDQGRTASSPAARGQILRLDPRSGTLAIPRFDGIFTAYQFQIQ
jgi:hypothetical protein